MRILLRIVLFVLALALLAGLVGLLSLLVPIPWLSMQVGTLMQRFDWLQLALAIVVVFFIAASVLALVLLVSVPRRRRQYVMPRDLGQIEITRQSVESAAAATLGSIPEVKRYQVHVRGDMRPGKVKLRAEIEPRNSQTDLAALGVMVQQSLARDMAACLELEPRQVKVKVTPVRHPVQESHAHAARVSRVV